MRKQHENELYHLKTVEPMGRSRDNVDFMEAYTVLTPS